MSNMYDDIIGHDTIKRVLQNTPYQSTIFEGATGIGKSTIARAYAANNNGGLNTDLVIQANGTAINTDFLRKIPTVPTHTLIIDEFQYLSKKQQQLLLEPLETGKIILIATTTENTRSFCFPAILSRCRVLHMHRPTDEEILNSTGDDVKAKFDRDVLENLVHSNNGDIRQILRDLSTIISASDGVVTKELYKEVFNKQVNNPATTESLKAALQKSIRGSDPNAASLYALQLMENGELEILCRRLRVILSEDIGLGNHNIIAPVSACIDNALKLGMPEARIPIINAVLMMSMSSKSNSVVSTISNFDELDKSNIVPPNHIASEYPRDYKYPHDYPNHYVRQQYMPDSLADRVLYNPSNPSLNEIGFISNLSKLRTGGEI